MLCQKFYLRQSLSRGWTYDAGNTAACAGPDLQVAASRIAAAAVDLAPVRPELLAPYHALRRRARRAGGARRRALSDRPGGHVRDGSARTTPTLQAR